LVGLVDDKHEVFVSKLSNVSCGSVVVCGSSTDRLVVALDSNNKNFFGQQQFMTVEVILEGINNLAFHTTNINLSHTTLHELQ